MASLLRTRTRIITLSNRLEEAAETLEKLARLYERLGCSGGELAEAAAAAKKAARLLDEALTRICV